ncbi:MAG: MarR family winged helix-turn-helix transcriptional regulator [Solirubrobacterales bacterium]
MSLRHDTPLNQVPLPALLEIASEAAYVAFRADLIEAGYGDIRPNHGCVFRFVHEDGMRLTELATLASMTKQSVGEIVDDLGERGYVERVPDPADRRAKLIRLTEKGETAQAVALEIFAALEKRLGERYGSDRLADLRTLLEEIIAAEAPQFAPELALSERLSGAAS